MKKIILLVAFSLFTVCSAYADIKASDINPDSLKVKNLKIADPDFIAIERRLTALEEENKNLKKQIVDLQAKLSGSSTILDAAIAKLTQDFKGHTHSLGTRIQVTGGSSFKAPGYGAAQFFLTGTVHDQNVQTGSAIVK